MVPSALSAAKFFGPLKMSGPPTMVAAVVRFKDQGAHQALQPGLSSKMQNRAEKLKNKQLKELEHKIDFKNKRLKVLENLKANANENTTGRIM